MTMKDNVFPFLLAPLRDKANRNVKLPLSFQLGRSEFQGSRFCEADSNRFFFTSLYSDIQTPPASSTSQIFLQT
jgi:hypothetical protein